METTEYGWLIENGKKGDELRYRDIEHGIPIWTHDNNQALRFARRVDAEKFAAEDEDAWRIVQHAWDTPEEPKGDTPCPMCNPIGIFRYSPTNKCICQGRGWMWKLG